MPTQGNPKLTIRMTPERRARFVAAAYNAGTDAAGLVNQFVDWYMREPGAELPQRPKEQAMTTTTNYGYWADHSGVHTDPRDDVLDFLGEYAADYDIDGLVDAYQDAINQQLPDDIALRGRDFFGPYPRREGFEHEIRTAIESVNLSDLAEKYDRTAQ